MQYDNNYTDKKLQELESQSLPDLTAMDQHWQQMRSLLQPAIVPAKSQKGNRKKIVRWILAAAVIGGTILVGTSLFKSDKSSKGKGVVVNNPNIKKDAAHHDNGYMMPPTDSEGALTSAGGNRKTKTVVSTIAKQKTRTDRLNPIKTNQTSTNQVTMVNPSITKTDDAIDPKVLLGNFFQQLEKPAQEFTISNKTDTIIHGRDGTALLVPANSFAGGNEVVITIREFYSYEDIVTNKLSTLSNNEQLVTGGMLHVMATINGKEVDVQPGKAIRWFIPDTSAAMKQMQLFNGVRNANSTRMKKVWGDGPHDTTMVADNNINWTAESSPFFDNYVYTGVKVLDLRNEPYKTTKNGSKAFFCIAPNSQLSKRELAAVLKEKYGYEKVKIRRKGSENGFWFSIDLNSTPKRLSEELGDSTWMDIRMAQTYNLPATDTTYSTRAFSPEFYFQKSRSDRAYGALFNSATLKQVSAKYSVDIRKLGWVNCDRFLNSPAPKVDYYVNLNDTATNYFTFLVFDRVKSMMSGSILKNGVMFNGVPQGESAKVISVGIQNGKPILAVKNVIISSGARADLVFESTTPDAFKQEVGTLDK